MNFEEAKQELINKIDEKLKNSCDHRFSVVVEWKFNYETPGVTTATERYREAGKTATKLACEKCGEIKEL